MIVTLPKITLTREQEFESKTYTFSVVLVPAGSLLGLMYGVKFVESCTVHLTEEDNSKTVVKQKFLSINVSFIFQNLIIFLRFKVQWNKS